MLRLAPDEYIVAGSGLVLEFKKQGENKMKSSPALGETSQLVSPVTKDWDFELIDKLGYPRKIFQKLIMPGTSIGHFSEAVKNEVGFDLEVVAPATHDTGSAVLAVPANDDDFIYISSGTWSLMGLERERLQTAPKRAVL